MNQIQMRLREQLVDRSYDVVNVALDKHIHRRYELRLAHRLDHNLQDDIEDEVMQRVTWSVDEQTKIALYDSLFRELRLL